MLKIIFLKLFKKINFWNFSMKFYYSLFKILLKNTKYIIYLNIKNSYNFLLKYNWNSKKNLIFNKYFNVNFPISISNAFELNIWIEDYFILFYSFLLSFLIACLLILISYIIGTFTKILDKEKTAPYECGFESMSDTRQPQNIRFYNISILFILFDIEICYIFPWAVSINDQITQNIDFLIYSELFILILSIGFLYELKTNILTFK